MCRVKGLELWLLRHQELDPSVLKRYFCGFNLGSEVRVEGAYPGSWNFAEGSVFTNLSSSRFLWLFLVRGFLR